jgi:hypothetical protein
MGKFSGRITSILSGKKEKIDLTGTTFEVNQKNLGLFKKWWKLINAEHFIIFWIAGALTMLTLSLLAYTTLFNKDSESGIGFLISEAKVISESTFPALGPVFILAAAAMLFFTQFSVIASTSRIMAENLVILFKDKMKIQNLGKYFYGFLWLQILLGVIIFTVGFSEPLKLVIVGAVLNAISMAFYSGLILWLNLTNLEAPLRPNFLRTMFMLLAFVFYSSFSLFTIFQFL